MANAFHQLHYQFVFAPRFRAALIQPAWEERLYQYMTGIVRGHKYKPLAIGGTADHIHLVIGMHPAQSISDFVEEIKSAASRFINESGLLPVRFEWQRGYGAFAYQKRMVPTLISYVRGQKEHHKRTTFLEEYRALLIEEEVEFEDRYIFRDPE